MTDAFAGQMNAQAWQSQANLLQFVFEQLASGMATASPVLVIACTGSGSVAAPGTVDVQPLVGMIDSAGKVYQHGTVFELPFARVQAGANAVIMDPQPGDIGIAVFCSQDISAVKASKAASPPGSFRRFDLADGIYLMGLFGSTPTRYLRWASDGIYLVAPDKVTVQAPEIDLTASSVVTVTAPTVNLGGTGGKKVVLDGDPVVGGVVQASSTHAKAL